MRGVALAVPPADCLAAGLSDGLALLERSPPLWPVGAEQWSAAVATVRGFAERWDGQARAAGWTALQLYGLHRRAPYANLAGMGAAWSIARSGHTAIAVKADAIVLVARWTAVQRFYRRETDAAAVLAWDLCGAGLPRARTREASEGKEISKVADEAFSGPGSDGEPTASGAAAEFLRAVLARGAVSVPDLEACAREAGYLGSKRPISQSKPFRSARAALGIKPFQPKGVKYGGWFWALPQHHVPSDWSDAPNWTPEGI